MSKIKVFILSLILMIISSVLIPSFTMAADDTNQTKEEIEFKLRKEELTFIPYRQLNKLLEKNQKLVYMSYKELKDLINEKSQIRPLAPVNYVIKDLALSGKVNNDHISFDAIYKVEILNKEWIYVPVMSTGVGLKSAEFDGKPAPISIDGSYFRILSDEIGEHKLVLKFDVKVTESGNSKSFQFNMPTLPITRLTINVPEVPVKLNIQGASGTRTEVKDNSTITFANLVGQGVVNVNWKSNLVRFKKADAPKVKPKESTLPSKVIATVETLISVDEGIIQGFSTYNCQIFHKPVEKLTIQIPDDTEIISVSSPGNIVRKGPPIITDPNGDKPGKVLNVYFNSKIKDYAIFNIAFEKTFENKNTTEHVPGIYLIGKEIKKVDGYIAIQSLGNVEIKEVEAKNISPDDQMPYELESSAQNPILLSYQYIITNHKDYYQLVLEITPSKDAPVEVAMIDNVSIDSRLSTNGTLTTRADYNIRNMSEQYFRFTLPEDSEILTGIINGQPVQIEKDSSEDDKEKKDSDVKVKTEYLINIKNHQDEKSFNLSVMYRQDYKFNLLSRILNLYMIESPKVIGIQTLTLSWSIYIPHEMKYWFITDLNKGYTNYASYITSNDRDYNGTGDYGESSVYDDSTVINRQVVHNVMPTSSEDIAGEKAIGILPPEFSMPPTTGLSRYGFADYLLGSNESTIQVFSVTSILMTIIYLALFLLMLYVAWIIALRSHEKIKTADSNIDRAKFFIPLAIILYIAGNILGFLIIWFPLIIAVAVYAGIQIYKQFKSKKIKSEI